MTGEELVRNWVDGWVLSRGAAPPLVEPWGYTIHVGLPHHVSRHVIGATNDAVTEEAVRKAAEATHGRDVHLKVFADPARVLPWLGPEWEAYGADDFLMSTDLTPAAAPPVPGGYIRHLWTRAGVTRVLLTDTDGAFAARGQVAPTGASAVVDQIETSEGHRRKGLGRVVMGTLQAEARALGATRAVLACTPEGRFLYESVGWRIDAPLANAKYVGPKSSPRGD
ncbi:MULTISPECIES: GNAT family N-acetyltransferase [unclassified Streptomyces]|uniref:GNAT family N-acetyltransferase n=1 Tax=unclassified Streptomyces TaxID=2593676 RepID=UPI00278C1D7A|nr:MULTISPECIES: GNAT family N-acetyltransferase [unclassified Streptomyces]